MNRSPLSVKLALFSAGMTVLVVGAAFLLLRSRVNHTVRRVFTQELAASQQGLRQLQERNLRLLLETSALVSTSPTLRAALQTWRMETGAGLPRRDDLLATIQREAERVFTDLDRDLLVVTDDQGVVLASVGAVAPRPGEALGGLPAVRHALSADSVRADSSFGVLLRDGARLQLGCVAITIAGFPTGALLLGDRLEETLAPFVAAAGTRAVVTVGEDVIASTLDAAPVGSRWAGGGEDPADSVSTLELGGESYVAASMPLGLSADGRVARLHLARSLRGSLAPITGALGLNFLLAGLFAVVLVGTGAALLSRATLQPLSRFVAFLRSGAAARSPGRYETTNAPAEIATLADAYNGLIDSLHERETQLRQSQKLESLGTLAGGIAHDFNNLLSVIIGYAQIASQDLPAGSPLRDDVGQISQAADRATGLVRQLLAFSRKQVLQPQVMDLNQVVVGMSSMLRRLIGEHIEFGTKLEPRLARITADPGQVEQVLMNLVVNARDAMPGGGTVTITTANVVLDERYQDRPEAIPAGPSVMVAVSDTGVGMDEATRSRIFEPFFTTKAPGKGTGLGLSTVYGIVRQSGGSITVYSEPGKGCTFRCYFPAAAGMTADAPETAAAGELPGGRETILVAEDDPQLRALVRRTLAGRGYTIIEACHGGEALELASQHAGPIHMLVTDVVMPQLSGKDLAERLQATRPDMRVLYMSGYSDEAIERHGVLTPGTVFIQKPVVPDALVRTVREMLDERSVAST